MVPSTAQPATASLLPIVLRDAAHMQEEDARRANQYGYTKHHPALPLFTRAQVDEALPLLQAHPTASGFPSLSAFVCSSAGPATSWDRQPSPWISRRTPASVWCSREISAAGGARFCATPSLVTDADILLIESTYGGRIHAGDPAEQLATIITQTARRGGTVIVPSFAIGRTQELIWMIRALEDAGRLRICLRVHRQPDGHRRD